MSRDWRGGACALALLFAGCSRPPSGDAPQTDGTTPTGTALPKASPSTPGSAESGLGSGPVLTPEDAEAETEHRITEQNLESELDRLEREIQAE